MSPTPKEDTSPATKTDIADLRQIIVKGFDAVDQRFGRINERLDAHDQQFDMLVKLVGSAQDDIATIKRDLRILSEKVLDDHDRRLMACERRLGLAV